MPPARPRSAAVVGASLVGLSTALALDRAGWRVTVLERSPAQPSGGTGIGIDRRLLSSVTGVGGALPVLNVGFPATAWGLLQAVLTEEVRCRPAIRVLRGRRVDAVQSGAADGGVLSTTAGALRADLIVGADGYRSVTRRYVAPQRPDAAYAGYLLWRGLIDEADLPGGLRQRDVEFAEHERRGARLVTFGVPGRSGETRPGGRRASYTWFDRDRDQLRRRTGRPAGLAGSLTGPAVPGEVVDELIDEAQRWPSPWRQPITDSLHRRDFLGTPVAEYLPDRLVRNAAVIVGDAAHVVSPVTGAGLHNGLLDVEALVAAVGAAPADQVPAALIAYERQRLGAARALVLSSQRWSRSYRARLHNR